MPLPEPGQTEPLCSGPDCFTQNGPCHPGGTPGARATQHSSVPSDPEQGECSKGNPGTQWHDRLCRFVGWVLRVAAGATIAYGVHVLIDVISTLP